jgi:6-phosphogluconolactonase (cycloisomerase 2 family)
MRVLTRLSACAGLAAVAVASPAAVAAAKTAHTTGTSPVAGYVYTDDNTATTNTVAGFARHADGSLTALSGSPFAAGGAGAAHGNTSQGSIVTADNGRFVLAVDNGSNQISVLRVGSGGALSLVGSPVSSGGTNPVSIGVSGTLVYVANAAPGAPNVTGFRLGFYGRLTPIADSTVALGATAQPDDVVINSTATNLIVPDVAQSVIYTYSISSAGLLTAAPDSPLTAQGLGPFGSAFNPTNPDQLFVSNAHNGTALGTVSAFSVGSDGTLTSIGASPFADDQTAPCWVAVTPNGKYLFAVNTAVPSVSSYAINSDGSLTLIGSFPFEDGTTTAPTDATVSGNDLYVDGQGSDQVAAFRIASGGFLSELASSPVSLPGGATPSGIAAS